MQLKRVVVTGMGAITPIGNTLEEYWNALVAGTSGAGLITHFDTSNYKVKFACEVKNFDALNFLDRKEARKMDQLTQYAMVSVMEAVDNAGLIDARFAQHHHIAEINTRLAQHHKITEVYTRLREHHHISKVYPCLAKHSNITPIDPCTVHHCYITVIYPNLTKHSYITEVYPRLTQHPYITEIIS